MSGKYNIAFRGCTVLKIKVPRDMVCGFIHKQNNGSTLEIVEYINAKKVKVRFIETGNEIVVRSDTIRLGIVADKLRRTCYGVGYFGVGDHKSSENGVALKKYIAWHGMMERCYSKRFQKIYKSYAGCSVCDEWHNFQVFGDWYDINYIEGYDLDKDVKIEGNKLYSPETCTFITRSENSIKAASKSYVFKSPSGEVINIYNLAKFCRENGLNKGMMYMVSGGRVKSHKGWTA